MNFLCVAVLRCEGLSIMTANYTLNHAFSDLLNHRWISDMQFWDRKADLRRQNTVSYNFIDSKTSKSNNMLLKNDGKKCAVRLITTSQVIIMLSSVILLCMETLVKCRGFLVDVKSMLWFLRDYQILLSKISYSLGKQFTFWNKDFSLRSIDELLNLRDKPKIQNIFVCSISDTDQIKFKSVFSKHIYLTAHRLKKSGFL